MCGATLHRLQAQAWSGGSSRNRPWPGLAGDPHLCGPDDAIAKHVAVAHNRHDAAAVHAIHGLGGESLVEIGIEGLPFGADALEAFDFEYRLELAQDQFDPVTPGIRS